MPSKPTFVKCQPFLSTEWKQLLIIHHRTVNNYHSCLLGKDVTVSGTVLVWFTSSSSGQSLVVKWQVLTAVSILLSMSPLPSAL